MINKGNYDLLFNNDSIEKTNSIIENYFLDGESQPMSLMRNTNSINIIVGSNNSGKSRFMRYLMKSKNIIGVKNVGHLNEYIYDYNARLREFNKIKIDYNIQNSYNRHSFITKGGRLIDRQEFIKTLQENKLVELNISGRSNYLQLNVSFQANKKKLSKLSELSINDEYLVEFNIINELTVRNYESHKSYFIPTLRSAHSLFQRNINDTRFSKIENDIFLDTINKYHEFENSGVEIFTGLHLYKEVLNSRNAKRSVRQAFEKFEKFISENFFDNKQVDIVAEFNKDDSLSGRNDSEIISIHIDGEKETRKLYELGDGIQSIVILMYKIFMADNNSFIFIDEPELNLHPGMQRLFLEQISTNPHLKNKNLTYFISTHSNHFLDLTLEKENISIYSFTGVSTDDGDKKFIVRNVNAGDNSLLKNLGVNNSSVFLANCSIWVEGISDRNYIKAFLNSYLRSLGKKAFSLKEDIDYAFFEYAGANIDHYFFKEVEAEETEELLSDINSLALNNQIFLLADSDNAKQTTRKGKRLLELEKQKKENFYPYIIWNIREIENLLSAEIWKEILISLCNKELIKENLKSIQERIDSALNEIDPVKYKKEYIGVFLNEVNQILGKINGKKILNESTYKKVGTTFGTLTNKRELSEILIEKEIDWKVFEQVEDIKVLTKSIYEFITKNKQ